MYWLGIQCDFDFYECVDNNNLMKYFDFQLGVALGYKI